jgi:hypothetical protein
MPIKSLSSSSLLNFAKYSSTLAGNAPFIPIPYEAAFDLLETTTLGTDAASVTFASLNSYAADYKHLQIRYVGRTQRATYANDGVEIYLNSDDTSDSNYNAHSLYGGGTEGQESGVISDNGFRYKFGVFTTSADTSGNFAAGTIDILDPFSSTKNTTLRIFYGFFEQVAAISAYSASRIGLASQLWNNTSPISNISIQTSSANDLAAGSRFSLYGVK